MSGTFDDVTAEQPTDTRLDNDAPWARSNSASRRSSPRRLRYSTRLETIHEWDDLDAWDAEYTGEGSAIAFEHPTARGFGSARAQ